HQRRNADRREGTAIATVVGELVVVAGGRKVASTLDVAPHELSHLCLVEMAASGEHQRVADAVVDHRLGIGPIDGWTGEELSNRVGRRRKLARYRDCR